MSEYGCSMTRILPYKDRTYDSVFIREKMGFIRTSKIIIYEYMTLFSKNVCTDKLDDIVNKYNNTYHSAFIRNIN